MKNVQMSAANKGVLSTARNDEGSEILTTHKKTQHKRTGFQFLQTIEVSSASRL
jgi:hypothetical protein